QVVGEPGDPASDLTQPAGEPDSASLQGSEVDLGRRPAGVLTADQLHRGLAQCRGPLPGAVEGAAEPAGRLEPPVDVEASVAAGHPGVTAHRERDLAAGALQLVGDLDAGRGCADHQDAA